MATDCDHDDLHLATVDHAPIDSRDSVAHTAFRLFVCQKCRRVTAFPYFNFSLTTAAYRAALEDTIRKAGFTLSPTQGD